MFYLFNLGPYYWRMENHENQTVDEFVARLQTMYGVEDGASKPEDLTALRYVIYARKSTDDSGKQERSIGDQIQVCQDAAERMGLNVVDVIHEERSAKMSENRPKFRQMLEKLLSGDYDGIVTWAPDRLARNMKEGGEIIDLLDRGDIKDIKFANGYYFQSDAAGKMMLGIAFVQAKQFSDQHSQNVKRGITRITAEGKCYDRPKHGYYKDKDKYLRPDGENWELIKHAFEMRLSREPKYSLKEIATWLEEQGYPLKTKHAERKSLVLNEKFVSDLLRDPFYAGALVFGKSIVNLSSKYNFEPIITPDEFDRIAKQDGINKKFALSEVIKPKGSVKADLMRGMVVCSACNHPMSTGITPKVLPTGIKNYFYFRCDTKDCKYKGASVRAKVILESAFAFLEDHPMNFERGYHAYRREMSRQLELRDVELLSKLKSLNKQLEGVRDKVQGTKELLKRHAEDAVLVREFKRDLKGHLTKQSELEDAIRKMQSKRDISKHAIESYESFIELFKNLAQRIQNITNMTDLDFVLRKVFMNFFVDGKKVVQITQNSPFGELCGTLNPQDSVMVAPRGIEPLLTA